MEYLRSLMCSSGGVREEVKVKELEDSRWNWLEKRNRSRSIALREEYRKEVKEREGFLERMKKNPILDQLAWDRVVSFVKEPKDLVNMWGMCEPWRKSVKLRITTALFSEIFPKLVEGGHLSTNDVLNCRSVCKAWRDSVDRYMVTQQLWEKKEVGDVNVFNVNLPSPRLSVNLYGDVNHEVALDSLIPIRSLREANGYIASGTKLFVRVAGGHRNEEDPHRFEANESSLLISAILQQLLYNVTHLHVECQREDQSELFINFTIILLRALKDLETLIFRGTRFVIVEAVHRILETTSFPPLKNLKTIVASSLHPFVISAMLKTYGSQLETLVIDKCSPCAIKFIQNEELPCLKRLDFECMYYYEPVSFSIWRGRLDTSGLTLKTPLLEEIDLRFIQISNINASSLFLSFNKFGWTLKKLQLTLQTTREQTVSFNSPLKLYVLEKLTLALDGIHLGNIDFLIRSLRLKELDLTEVFKWPEKAPCKQDKSEHIKFSSFRDRLYESNIWRIFPELKDVRIKLIIRNVDNNMKRVFVYDRFGYSKFDDKKGSDVSDQ